MKCWGLFCMLRHVEEVGYAIEIDQLQKLEHCKLFVLVVMQLFHAVGLKKGDICFSVRAGK